MVECSLCSFMSVLFSCTYNVASCALEYPLVVFLFSLFIGFVFVTNIHTAKLICDFRCPGPCPPANCGDSDGNRGSCNNYDYTEENGPHTWNYTETNQSPINITNEYVQKFPIRELLTWNHYDDLPTSMTIQNNGHTVTLRATFRGNTPTVCGADLLASYTFVELCFRWSLLNGEGSEHMLCYKRFPLEMQVMHRTGPQGECTSSYDLLMIAYFFEISANNPYLDPLIQNLHRVERPSYKVEIPPFPLSYLCHQFRTGFYSYGGSLTEPPCYQGAEWFVFPEPLAISERQLNEFRQLLSSDGRTRIVRNARPVQNVGCSRVINLNQYNPMETCQMEIPECDDPCEDEESCE